MRDNNYRYKKSYDKICSICGDTFTTPYSRQHTCSDECRRMSGRINASISKERRFHNAGEENDLCSYEPCDVCGDDRKTKIFISDNGRCTLCPLHHRMVVDRIATLDQLMSDVSQGVRLRTTGGPEELGGK